MSGQSGRGGRGRTSRALVAAGAGFAALTLALTGCAGQGTAGNTDQPAASTGGKVTLNFWNGFTGPDGPALQQVVKDFNASQDQVEVKTKYRLWVTSGERAAIAATLAGCTGGRRAPAATGAH